MELKEPDPGRVEAFWAVARGKVSWTSAENLIGQLRRGTVQPPAVQLDDLPLEATRLADLLAKGEPVELTDAFDPDDELSEPGDLMIVCDGDGKPVSLAQTTSVQVDGAVVTERVSSLYPKR